MNYKVAPNTWNESSKNPFAANGDYIGWSIVKLDKTVNGFIMGKSSCGCYSVTFNPMNLDFEVRIFDFVNYETAHNRQVLISSPKFDFDTSIFQKKQFSKDCICLNDPKWLVHSTTLDSYNKIIKSGLLKSAATLNREGIITTAIGFEPLGEPEDYLEFVMFAPMDGFGSGSEMVVNSHLKGYACFDPNAEYIPQARMYFDANKIIEDGLAVRDGVHSIKVYEKLLLEPYLLMTVFEKDVQLSEGEKYWTPSLFTTAANQYFEIKQITDSIAPCGLVYKLCHLADNCGGCKSENNCCGMRKSTEGCYQYNCCDEKGIDGCWECEIASCDKGMFSESHDVRLRAFITYIKQNGKDKLAEQLYHNAINDIHYGHGRDYDNLGSIDAVLERIEGR